MAEINIVPVAEEHLACIVALAESWQLSTLEDNGRAGVASTTGFLVSDYKIDDYRARIDSAEFFLAAFEEDELVGFMLAYLSDNLREDEWVNRRIQVTLGPFLVIKQVCVSPTRARSGVASRLYYEVLCAESARPVIAAVVDEPKNLPSAAFHKKLGFEELTTLVPPDGIKRTIWVSREPKQDVLMQQYGIAVDLYKHEDALNWQKMNNFLYVTIGLLAATAFAVGEGAAILTVPRMLVLLGIALLGLVSSVSFYVMIFFGRRYMHARKTTVIRFEEHMAWHGGQRIVGRAGGDPENTWLAYSPTGLVMIATPLVIAAFWLAAIVGLTLLVIGKS